MELEFEKQKKILEEQFSRIMAEQIKMTQQSSKWLSLTEKERNKILKVRELAERGEAGEKEVAKEMYANLLKKNNITSIDVPGVKN